MKIPSTRALNTCVSLQTYYPFTHLLPRPSFRRPWTFVLECNCLQQTALTVSQDRDFGAAHHWSSSSRGVTHVNIFVFFSRILQVQVIVSNVMPSNRKFLVALTTPLYFWRRKPFHSAFQLRDLLRECRDFWNGRSDKHRLSWKWNTTRFSGS